MSRSCALLALTEAGAATARRLQAALPEAELHGLSGRVSAPDVPFDDTGAQLAALFGAGRAIVAFCSAGIVVRLLAPLLADKHAEPPVVAVSEDGAAVVPLLGGHRGANRLAEAVAEALGGIAAITTAGDRRFGVALDDPPRGYALANPEHHKAFVATLLAGASVRLEGSAPWLFESGLPLDEGGSLTIAVGTARDAGSAARLVFHPQALALGIGCERGTDPAEAIALAERTLAEYGLAACAVAGIVSLDLKSDEPALHAAAAHFGVPARFFPASRLEAEAPRLATPSELVFREVGCHGVAEGAALAAAGSGGVLVAPKRKSARATCAVAASPEPIDMAGIGRPQGRLAVVGIGPGSAEWRTGEARVALDAASDIVGFDLYLDLLPAARPSQTRHPFPIGAEEPRVRHALDLAAEGRSVALVSSGDAGIYAMATLVFELLDRGERPDWRRVAVSVCPGISALQAAAARAGAPLGHDFCTISLSDLLTPWPAIEKRLQAAAEADFAVALYNPLSKRRDWQLPRALEILGACRPADTPVVVARNLGRPGEAVSIVPLAAVTPSQIDMLTVLIVGASTTRRLDRSDGSAWAYTPRGYGTGRAKPEDAA